MGEEEEDLISVLPDCLILEILSRLPSTKEAINTGTLSKRWQHLWTIVPNLIFLRYVEDNRPLHEFFSLVENTLTQCRHLNLNTFKLWTEYNIRFEPQFNHWIQYAIKCNVQKLDLSLWSHKFVLNDYFFTTTCFTHLTLSSCIFNLSPGGVITWNRLTNLCISFGKLNEVLIQTILSGSPLLETLELSNCYGYKRLNITSKSVKNLLFTGYINREREYGNNADIIEINAPYILSLRIEDDLFLWKLLLLNVSSLVEAFLDYYKKGYYDTTAKEAEEEMLKGFILKLRHVNKLTIGDSCAGTLSRLEAKGLTFPSHLEVLDVSSDEVLDWEDEDSEVDELFDSDSDENGDWEGEGSEADEPFDSDSSDENEDWEDGGSEVDELFDIGSDENEDWEDEGSEADEMSHSDSVDSGD
ncbi:F-box protein-like protein [Tanacetum coccineum]